MSTKFATRGTTGTTSVKNRTTTRSTMAPSTNPRPIMSSDSARARRSSCSATGGLSNLCSQPRSTLVAAAIAGRYRSDEPPLPPTGRSARPTHQAARPAASGQPTTLPGGGDASADLWPRLSDPAALSGIIAALVSRRLRRRRAAWRRPHVRSTSGFRSSCGRAAPCALATGRPRRSRRSPPPSRADRGRR